MSNARTPQPVTSPEHSSDPLTRVLACSAIALVAAVLWQAASLPRAEAKMAAQIGVGQSGMVTSAGAHAMMSTATPNQRFATLVLDQRAESLLVYSSGSGDRIELLGRYNLPELFRSARAAVDNP